MFAFLGGVIVGLLIALCAIVALVAVAGAELRDRGGE